MRTAWRLANPVVAGIVALGAYAQEPALQTVETPKQQRVALVLSGGGARGAAHIGTLKVLEELHIVPDMLIGTSMGSIVGGLYAAGWSPAEIEKLLNEVDWNLVFSDSVEREDKPFRRKLDDDRIFVQGRLHFDNGKPYVPPGLLGGQRLELLLDTIEMVSSAPADFDQMPVPFRAVAVDIGTGEAVVIGSGRLSRAMRASMAIPGMFPAVERDGHTLSDGGAVANLPVRVARDLGANAVIAVDITSPLVKEGESYHDFFSVFNRMNSMLTFFNRVEDVKTIGPDDVYIRPELGDISFLAFDRATEAVGIGEAAAREKIDALKRFASTDDEWHAYTARRTPRDRSAVSVDVIDIENTSGLDDRVVRANLELEPARSVGLNTIRKGVMSLKALEAFGTVLTRLEPGPGGNRLVLNLPPPAYGRDSLQIGVSLQDDLQGYTNYSVFFRHLVQPINRLGGEIASTFELGEPFQFSSELYQPLEETQHWFVSPGVEVRRDLFTFWAKGEPVGELQIKSWKGRLDLGRVLGNWGDVAVRVYHGNAEGAPDSGLALAFRPFDLGTGGVLMRLRVDTRDRTVFPRAGAQARAVYDHGSESLGAEESYRRWILTASNAFSWGENTVNPYIELGDNLEDNYNLTNAFFLGGLGRLSGYGQKELFGERVAFGRVTYYRRLARLDLASLRLRAYVGASLEYGNTFGTDQALQAKSMIMAGGPFVAADTPIGPLFFGWGIAEGHRSSFYVLVGEPL